MKKFTVFCGLLVLLAVLLPGPAALAFPGSKALAFSSPALASAGSNTLILTGQDATVPEGTKYDTVVVFGADAHIDGRVTGEVVAIGGSIYLGSTAVVEGQAVAIGGKVESQPGAKVYGEQVSLGITSLLRNWPSVGKWVVNGPGYKRWSPLALWRYLLVLFLGIAVFWLFPRPAGTIAATITQNPAKSTLFGLLAHLALVPATIVLLITILGIPLVPLLFLAVLAGRFLGQIALGLVLGRRLGTHFNWETAEVLLVLLGLALLGLVTFIPLVGTFASIFYSLIGFGAVVWSRLGTKLPPIGKGGNGDEELV